MWAKDAAVKEDGQKILGNYKKQIAEKMARDQAEAGMIRSRTTSDSKSNYSGGGNQFKKTGTSYKSANKETKESRI